MSRASVPTTGKAIACIWFGAWAVGGLLFTGLAIRAAYRHAQSSEYPHVPGQILSSGSTAAGKGSVSLSVEFSYRVNGIEYTGNVYRHGSMSMPSGHVDEIVRALPAGTTVDVYFNPDAPADSLLQPGFRGDDLLHILFAGIPNLIWIAGLVWWRDTHPWDQRLEHVVYDDQRVARIRLAIWLPLSFAMWISVAAAVSVVMLCVTTFYPPSIAQGIGMWLIVVVIGILAYKRRAQYLAEGHLEIVLDRASRTLTLPPSSRRHAQRRTFAWRSIAEIEVEEGGTENGHVHYRCILVVRNDEGATSREQFMERSDEEDCERMAAWLRGEIQRLPRVKTRMLKLEGGC